VSEQCDDEYERQAFRVVTLGELPATGVTVVDWPLRNADWYTIARTAVDVLGSGVDPMDRDAVQELVSRCDLVQSTSDHVMVTFTNPIAMYDVSRQWVNGRHRVQAMREAGAERCVLQVLT
jgi:hypothetical protein